MADEFVTYRGKKYAVKKGKLELRFKKMTDISEIEGLENLTNLKTLILDHNKLTEIKELEYLTFLEELDIRHNQISELKGLEHLANLEKLYIAGNPLPENEKNFEKTAKKNAQEVVRYCAEKAGLSAPTVPPVMTPVETTEGAASPSFSDVSAAPSAAMRTCPSCGFAIEEEDMLFCPNCGTALASTATPTAAKTCPSCGFASEEEDMLFCANCGTKL